MRGTVYQGMALLLIGLGLLIVPGVPVPAQTPTPEAPGEPCPVCRLWMSYAPTLERARQEVGPLKGGVIYFYHSNEPAVIEPLIRFAYERAALSDTLRARPELAERLGRDCEQGLWHVLPYELQISTSAHGFFAILTSTDWQSVKRIQSTARIAVPRRLPVWF